MKKNLAVLFAALMLVLAGCGGNKNPTEEPKNNHVVDYKLDVPDGFEPMEIAGMDAAWYRADNSNINLVITQKAAGTDAEFQAVRADDLRSGMVDQMKSIYGLDAEITDRYFTRNEVCGLPAYQYCYDMSLAGQEMTQIIVCINADRLYTFSFTALDADTLAAFEACAKNIQLTFG